MTKAKPSRHAPHEVDDYLAALPDDKRATLEQLRAIIRASTSTRLFDSQSPIR